MRGVWFAILAAQRESPPGKRVASSSCQAWPFVAIIRFRSIFCHRFPPIVQKRIVAKRPGASQPGIFAVWQIEQSDHRALSHAVVDVLPHQRQRRLRRIPLDGPDKRLARSRPKASAPR